MKPIGGDSDLGSHAELSAIGKLRGSVMEDDGTVDVRQKPISRSLVVRHDGLSMSRPILRNVGDSRINTFHDPSSDNRVEILGVPVVLASRPNPRINLLHRRVPPNLAPRIQQIRNNRRKVRINTGAIHQQRLSRAANTGATHLRINNDGACHPNVGVTVNIHVAVTLKMPNDRHPSLLLHPLNQALPTAGNDNVDVLRHPRQHVSNSRAIRHRHKLHTLSRQPSRAQPLNKARVNSRTRMPTLRPAAQNDSVPGLHTQSPRISRHIGPTLIDDPNDSQGNANTLNVQPVGAIPLGRNRANRIRQR